MPTPWDQKKKAEMARMLAEAEAEAISSDARDEDFTMGGDEGGWEAFKAGFGKEATYGFGDEAAAALSGVETTDEERIAANEEMDAVINKNAINAALGFVGGVVPSIAGLAYGTLTKAAAKAAALAATKVAGPAAGLAASKLAAKEVIKKITPLKAIGINAAEGAVSGVGEGEGVEGRVLGGVIGAGVGTVVGGSTQAAGKFVEEAVNRSSKAMRSAINELGVEEATAIESAAVAKAAKEALKKKVAEFKLNEKPPDAPETLIDNETGKPYTKDYLERRRITKETERKSPALRRVIREKDVENDDMEMARKRQEQLKFPFPEDPEAIDIGQPEINIERKIKKDADRAPDVPDVNVPYVDDSPAGNIEFKSLKTARPGQSVRLDFSDVDVDEDGNFIGGNASGLLMPKASRRPSADELPTDKEITSANEAVALTRAMKAKNIPLSEARLEIPGREMTPRTSVPNAGMKMSGIKYPVTDAGWQELKKQSREKLKAAQQSGDADAIAAAKEEKNNISDASVEWLNSQQTLKAAMFDEEGIDLNANLDLEPAESNLLASQIPEETRSEILAKYLATKDVLPPSVKLERELAEKEYEKQFSPETAAEAAKKVQSEAFWTSRPDPDAPLRIDEANDIIRTVVKGKMHPFLAEPLAAAEGADKGYQLALKDWYEVARDPQSLDPKATGVVEQLLLIDSGLVPVARNQRLKYRTKGKLAERYVRKNEFGDGAYGRVYSVVDRNGKPKVAKISYNTGGGYTQTHTWEKNTARAIQNVRANATPAEKSLYLKHFPDFEQILERPDDPGGYIIVMDELRPMRPDEEQELFRGRKVLREKLKEKGFLNASVTDDLPKQDFVIPYDHNMATRPTYGAMRKILTADDYSKMSPRVRSFYKALEYMSDVHGIHWGDLHEGNVMIDPKTNNYVAQDTGLFQLMPRSHPYYSFRYNNEQAAAEAAGRAARQGDVAEYEANLDTPRTARARARGIELKQQIANELARAAFLASQAAIRNKK